MPKPRRILVAQADHELSYVLARDLTHAGFEAATVASAEELRATIAAPDARFDALILGACLPDADGYELCVRLRQDDWTAPILMLADVDAEHEVVRGLEAGAIKRHQEPIQGRH